jgi:DNA replication ATP-dependent helicase Dna2
MGEHSPERDEDRLARAQEALSQRGLNETQFRAGTDAIASDSLSLIQGPPGTGKTRLLAEILRVLCSSGCKIALSAFTHRAVDNALLAIARIAPEVPLVKLGRPGPGTQGLIKAGIRFEDPRRGRMPQEGAVVAGTCFALSKLPARERFHFTVFDEAGQLPIPHALAGMLLARRWIFFGDHRQLPPVITAEHADREVKQSVFERLHGFYGAEMLDETYRMNDRLCAVVSDLFYAGQLKSAASVGPGRMPFSPGGNLDSVLAPEHSVVFARVDHLQPGQRSAEEARLVADLLADLIDQHGLDPASIAVIAPFRAQVRLLRASCQGRGIRDLEKITIDTVERIQGQEREVIILSLAVGDPETLNMRAAFFFSKNRLNVALSRARTKAILVASSAAFRALPQDPDSLRAVASFRRLTTEVPQVDLTSIYCAQADAGNSKADGGKGQVTDEEQDAQGQAEQHGAQELGEAAM